MNQRRWFGFGVAAALGISAISSLYWGVSQFAPARSSRGPSSTDPEKRAEPPPNDSISKPEVFDLPDRSLLTDRWAATERPELVAKVVAVAELRLQEAGSTRLTPEETHRLCAAAGDFFAVSTGGSLPECEGYIHSLGGVLDQDAPGADPTRAASIREFNSDLLGAFSQAPSLVSSLRVRPRVVGGKTIPQSDFGLIARSTFRPGRYPGLQLDAYMTDKGYVVDGDTYEFIIPVEQAYEGHKAVTLFGVWLTRSRSSGVWMPSKTVSYSAPTEKAIVVQPPM